MVADVQSWLDNPATNFGWLVLGDESMMMMTAKRFDTRESNNPPVLTIQYHAARPNTFTDSYSNTYTECNSDSHTNCYSECNPNTERNSDSDTDTYRNSYPKSDTQAAAKSAPSPNAVESTF